MAQTTTLGTTGERPATNTGLSPVTPETEAFWEEANATIAAQLDAAFGPEKPARVSRGSRFASITDLQEGTEVVTIRPVGWGATGRRASLAVGSVGTVEYVTPADGTAMVVFADAATGEVIRVDVYSWELRVVRAEKMRIGGGR